MCYDQHWICHYRSFWQFYQSRHLKLKQTPAHCWLPAEETNLPETQETFFSCWLQLEVISLPLPKATRLVIYRHEGPCNAEQELLNIILLRTYLKTRDVELSPKLGSFFACTQTHTHTHTGKHTGTVKSLWLKNLSNAERFTLLSPKTSGLYHIPALPKLLRLSDISPTLQQEQ